MPFVGQAGREPEAPRVMPSIQAVGPIQAETDQSLVSRRTHTLGRCLLPQGNIYSSHFLLSDFWQSPQHFLMLVSLAAGWPAPAQRVSQSKAFSSPASGTVSRFSSQTPPLLYPIFLVGTSKLLTRTSSNFILK